MDPVSVRLFGQPRVVTDSGAVPFPTRKAAAIFAYLVLNPGVADRERLATKLWPDASDSRAKRNLSTEVWRLKRLLIRIPDTRLEISSRLISLECGTEIVDVLKFKYLAGFPDVQRGSPRQVLADVTTLVSGDLLDGFTDDWCETERRYLREMHLRLLRRLAETSKEDGDFETTLEVARKIVQTDPFDEDAHHDLMLSYYLLGDRASAMAQYETLRQLLSAELGVKPSSATVEFWQYIRSQARFRSEPRRIHADKIHTIPGEFAPVSMVGRGATLEALTQLLGQAAKSRGSAVVISGDAGIGKTKLVEVLLIESGLRGFDVLVGRCLDMPDPPPYHVFVQALWARMTSARSLGDDHPTPLSALLQAVAPDLNSPNTNSGQGTQPGIFDSAILTETLLSLLSGDHSMRPTLLVLEDVHRADMASAAVLVNLLRRLGRSKLLVVATLRVDGPQGSKLLSSLLANGAQDLKLGPLSEMETRELICAMLGVRSPPDFLTHYVQEKAGGIPLFVLEFVKFLRDRGMLTKDDPHRWRLDVSVTQARIQRVPSRVHEIIKSRIDILDSGSRRVLHTAAVMGSEMRLDQLMTMVGMPVHEFLDCSDHLVEAQLLLETGRGFRFPHESIRYVALFLLSRSRLKMLHLRAARLIEHSSPWLTEDLAWHFEEAGLLREALFYSEASGEKARAVYANVDAVTWYTRALQILEEVEHAENDDDRTRVRLLQRRQEVLEILGDRERQSADIEAIFHAAMEMRDWGLEAEAQRLRASVFNRVNRSGDALKSVRRALKQFSRIGDTLGMAKSCETYGLAYMNIRRYDLAPREFGRALVLFRRCGDRVGEARCLVQLGTVLGFRNRNFEALKYLDEADTLLAELRDPRSQATVNLQRGIIYRCLGKMRMSETLLKTGIDILRQIGDRVWEARGLSQLAYTHAALGRLRDAAHESETALRIARQAGDVRAEIVILNNTAFSVFRLLGYFKRAEGYVLRAMRLVEDSPVAENAATYNDTLAAVLLDKGDLEGAVHWAKLSETLYRAGGVRTWVGVDIDFRLGCVFLELGQEARSLRYLERARRELRANKEVAAQLLVVTTIARLHCLRRNLPEALSCADEMSRLMLQIDGAEHLQRAYWVQYEVFREAKKYRAARNALRRAKEIVLSQSAQLKGPMSRRFLQLRLNSMILKEVGRDGWQPGTVRSRKFKAVSHDSGGELALPMNTPIGFVRPN